MVLWCGRLVSEKLTSPYSLSVYIFPAQIADVASVNNHKQPLKTVSQLAKAQNKIAAPWKPYLVRCVSAGDVSRECIAEEDANGRLCINSGILTHYGVDSVDHTPVIVLLKSAPTEIMVSFSEAE
jgi:hypothetical protein